MISLTKTKSEDAYTMKHRMLTLTLLALILVGCTNADSKNSLTESTDTNTLSSQIMGGGEFVDLDGNAILSNAIPTHPNMSLTILEKLDCLKSIEQTANEDTNFSLSTEETYYVSAYPIYHYIAKDGQYSDVVSYVVYNDSTDPTKIAMLDFLVENGTFQSFSLSYSFYPAMYSLLNDDPEKIYVFAHDNWTDLLIDSDNTLYLNNSNETIHVTNNFFQKLLGEQNGISFNKLFNENNRIEITPHRK